MSRVTPQPIARVAGVAGWPVHHSLSPIMHTFWLRKAGINGAYIPFAVRSDEAEYAFKTLKKTSLVGMNVTMPLKGLAYQAADEHTPDARKLGVSNCLYIRGGKLIAHNTDMEGFAAPLLENVSHDYLIQSPTVLIGSGGASRAVIGALLSLGVPEIRLLNRTDSKAIDMASQIDIPSLYAVPWSERNKTLRGAGLIINGTSAGMKGMPRLDINIAYAQEGAWVYDLVYNPLETRLMREARRAGLNVIGGLDMLIAQARPSFKAFYGQLPPIDADPAPLLISHLSAS